MAYKKPSSIKNHLRTKYTKLKDVALKTEGQIKYRQNRNLLSTLIKNGKRSYFIKLLPKQLR